MDHTLFMYSVTFGWLNQPFAHTQNLRSTWLVRGPLLLKMGLSKNDTKKGSLLLKRVYSTKTEDKWANRFGLDSPTKRRTYRTPSIHCHGPGFKRTSWMTVEHNLLNDFPRGNPHVLTVLWRHNDITQTVRLTQMVPSTGIGRSARTAHSESSLPLTVSNGCAPPDSFIGLYWERTLPGGPSHNGPMPIRCLWGVAVLSPFPKGLASISVFRMSDFPKRSIFLATLLRLLPQLNLFALGRLRDGFPTTRQPRMLKRSLQCDNSILVNILNNFTIIIWIENR